jgi:hypothetical protein
MLHMLALVYIAEDSIYGNSLNTSCLYYQLEIKKRNEY